MFIAAFPAVIGAIAPALFDQGGAVYATVAPAPIQSEVI